MKVFWNNRIYWALQTIKYETIELLYPSNIHCIICEQPISYDEPHSICQSCMAFMDFSKEGLQHVENIENKYFENLFAATYYYEHEKQLIYDFKYNQKPYLAKEIASMIVSKIGDKHYDGIIAVPLSKEKYNQRHYNQADEIVKYLSYQWKIPRLKNVLVRVKDTMPLNDLSPLERIMNLNGAFQVSHEDKIRNKDILLIDDIYTTGSTVDECAKSLMISGAKSVDVAVFARAVFDDDKND